MLGTELGTARGRVHFEVDATASAVLVEARSNVGLVSFGTTQVAGALSAFACEGRLDTSRDCLARLTVPLETLTSGNALYDTELQQRLTVRRYPLVMVELLGSEPVSGPDHHVSGEVTIHGVTAVLHGDVRITQPDPETVQITGESVLDIRDFGIPVPSVLMLRIYPDVRVSLHLVARRTTGPRVTDRPA